MDLHDDFTDAADGPIAGRVAPTGQVWGDVNDSCRISSGRIIRDPADEGHTRGSYADIHIGAHATLMQADISFTGTSSTAEENASVVLISAADPERGGTPPDQGIYINAIHAIFGCRQASIAIWEEHAAILPVMISYTYPGGCLALDGTVYRVAIYLDGNRLGALMPDGVTRWAGDARLDTYTGQHLIYQTYNGTALNCYPRIEEVWADTAPLGLVSTVGTEMPY